LKIGYLLQLGEEIRHPPFNGPANHVRQVFRGLADLGHEVSLLCRLDDRLWLTRDLETFETVATPHVDRGFRRLLERIVRRTQSAMGLPYFGYFESRRFASACLRELHDCDVLYERFSWMTYGGLLAARGLGVPWVAEYNGDPLADLESKGIAPSGLQRKISVAIARRSLRRASHVVATGDGWRRNCVERWGVDPVRVSVVENGTDLLGLLDRDALRSFRPESEADGETRIVYLGGFHPWHGIDKLLRATAALAERGAPVHVTLIGSGSGLPEARQLSERLGLIGRVKFAGRMKAQDYARILADSDIGVSPYCDWPEFSGLKIFDYKAAGLACVASGVNGQPPTLSHGRTGWIVPPCDVLALESALGKLVMDGQLRRSLGRAARLDAESTHGWAHTARALVDVLERVAGSSTSSGQNASDYIRGTVSSGPDSSELTGRFRRRA
jgi:glycosyltransferase involved in cell wall biosynthesis